MNFMTPCSRLTFSAPRAEGIEKSDAVPQLIRFPTTDDTSVKDLFSAKMKKAPDYRNRWGLFGFYPGGNLRSHAVASAVSSARRGLTSVFGMGTGVSPAVWPPGNLQSGTRNSETGTRKASPENKLQIPASEEAGYKLQLNKADRTANSAGLQGLKPPDPWQPSPLHSPVMLNDVKHPDSSGCFAPLE